MTLTRKAGGRLLLAVRRARVQVFFGAFIFKRMREGERGGGGGDIILIL